MNFYTSQSEHLSGILVQLGGPTQSTESNLMGIIVLFNDIKGAAENFGHVKRKLNTLRIRIF